MPDPHPGHHPGHPDPRASNRDPVETSLAHAAVDDTSAGLIPAPGEFPTSSELPPEAPAPTTAGLSAETTSRLVGGTSMLGVGMLIERGTGFLGNVLAARLGGTQTFGAYSLGISTANQISTYAAGQIGSTAARFSGKYPYGSPGYTTLARALAIVSVVSALLAAGGLWLGAVPLAHLMGKAALTGLLRWASVSAAGIVLLECARGFFVGQRRLFALLLLSVLVGGGLVTLLPLAAHTHLPTRMIVLQGAITTSAVVVCLLFARPLKLHPPAAARAVPALPLRPVLVEIWTFGLVQLAGLIGANLAGWWLTTLVARADTTLVQMSFFSVASQLRNLAGIAPGLLTEGSYAVMADPEESSNTPQRVLGLCTFGATAVSLLLAALGTLIAPWALTLFYGRDFAPAALTVAAGLATAVVHMGNAPASARLTIVSIRSTGIINTVWAITVAAAALLFFLHGGEAWGALAIYFCAHTLSSALTLLVLHRRDTLPSGMASLFVFSSTGVALLGSLAWLRLHRPTLSLPLTGAMLLLTLALAAGLYLFGRRHRWLPSPTALRNLAASLRNRLPRRAH